MTSRITDLRTACLRAKRAFETLEISYETQILIAPTRDGVREQLKAMLALTPPNSPLPQSADFMAFIDGSSDAYPSYLTDAWLVGTPDEVTMQLQQYQALGVSHFMLWFMDAPQSDGMRLFMEQVAPRFTS
jgi:alkanesulfonate monooxygenase SsuD/methylene tetrahydromethanopterin reductase-like flavin-dependent oxidoreductase (luciferase family)